MNIVIIMAKYMVVSIVGTGVSVILAGQETGARLKYPKLALECV